MVAPAANARKLLRKGWKLEYHCREWSAVIQEMNPWQREFYDYGHVATNGRNQITVCFFCHEYLLTDEDGRLFVAGDEFVIEEEPV